jgi:hypothetical protein
MKITQLQIGVLALASVAVLAATSARAEDDPNAAITAETARINAETAKINAEAALNTAKAAKDKAAVEALGLPKIENKTTLENNGGAIETSMLAGYAVSAAALELAGKVKASTRDKCDNTSQKLIVLAGNATFDLNGGRAIKARMNYLVGALASALKATEPRGGGRGPASIGVAAITAAISAASSLFASDVKVAGVDLTEINDAMLANAVAGQLAGCAYLPSAALGIADLEHSALAETLGDLTAQRQIAELRMNAIVKSNKDGAVLLKAVIVDFDAFNKLISTANEAGQTPFISAILAEQLASKNPWILRVFVNKAGGTITNTKNIATTLFAADPVRVSGGLIASYALVAASDGGVKAAGSFSCQTARVRLGRVQNGNWRTRKLDDEDKKAKSLDRQTAYCK